MKRKFLSAMIICFSLFLYSEDFLVVNAEPASSTEQTSEYSYGHIDSPIRITKKQIQSNRRRSTIFPERFDLREENKITQVKDQNPLGSCWTFAANGAVESSLMPTEEWDFSEDHIVNTHGFDGGPNDGGNTFMATAYLTRWSGPVLEEDDPYADGYSPNSIEVQKHVQEVLFIPNLEDEPNIDEIKGALMEYGAVQSSMYWDDMYFNKSTHSYYCNNTVQQANHDILIVGWDDTYSKENFLVPPETNGAFIIKNSWGEEFGENGYFYIAYDDVIIGTDSTVYTGIEGIDNYDQIYQHDPLGATSHFGYGQSEGWFANVFTPQGDNELLKAIGFYTLGEDTTYEIYVENNYRDEGDLQGMQQVASGTMSMPGYHTIVLDQPVSVYSNKKFAVMVKVDTPKEDLPIAVEAPIAGYSSEAKANLGESYISPNGDYWNEISDEGKNVCLKAFTIIEEATVTPDETWDVWEVKKTDDPMKEWVIGFNMPIQENSIQNNIYITDNQGNKIEDITIYKDMDNGKNVKVKPSNSYEVGITYYLYITTKVQSDTMAVLKKGIKVPFVIEQNK